jgi:hypothetical protein
MKSKTATPPAGANGDGAHRPTTALERLLEALPAHGFKPCSEPMAGIPSRMKLSEEQARRLERTGAVALSVQTVGLTAKERAGRPRARGAGRPAVRGSSRRSSARSGDSGEDGEPEPPQAGRLCQCGCGRSIDHLRRDARYFEACCRVRAQRARDEADSDRVAERDLARLMAASVDLAPVPCRCDPRRHLVDAGVCLHCGRARELSLEPAGATA